MFLQDIWLALRGGRAQSVPGDLEPRHPPAAIPAQVRRTPAPIKQVESIRIFFVTGFHFLFPPFVILLSNTESFFNTPAEEKNCSIYKEYSDPRTEKSEADAAHSVCKGLEQKCRSAGNTDDAGSGYPDCSGYDADDYRTEREEKSSGCKDHAQRQGNRNGRCQVDGENCDPYGRESLFDRLRRLLYICGSQVYDQSFGSLPPVNRGLLWPAVPDPVRPRQNILQNTLRPL